MKRIGWIAVDLDGTLAHYDRWRGIDHIGEPIPAMVERVKRWLAEGRVVKVFTARASEAAGIEGDPIAAIKRWCVLHIGQELEVTNVKDFSMIEAWDDRAIAIEKNTGVKLGGLSHVDPAEEPCTFKDGSGVSCIRPRSAANKFGYGWCEAHEDTIHEEAK